MRSQANTGVDAMLGGEPEAGMVRLRNIDEDLFAQGIIAKRAEQSLGNVRRVGKKRADLVTDPAFPQDPVALQLGVVDQGQADRMRLADPALEEPIAGREEMCAVVSRERGEGHL